ncbi:MAG: GTPase domain-containing protein [Schwartzia sp.]|nr:GTPase domain-containing protein [Schwartzia sp. (in: firmicutes)]MBO6210412.1 GTPase domain-containing protein [Schwartzia sp. (in: firmicutes)]MBO6235856.1 GTPase domain-containing protein [Schwartzia sp. (in: firmicutes)]MBP3690369.1 GTPase domain-containing protein [Schwartzia sp. (in: firmicutes)]
MENGKLNLEEEMQAKWEEKKRELEEEVHIALVGQPGAGKSSLINKLIGRKLFETGVHTDTTVDMQEAAFGTLRIHDLPGYGTARFPVERWVEEFHPEQYDLYLFVFEGKLHDSDAILFTYLKQWRDEREHPFFIVRNKKDQIWDEEKPKDALMDEIAKDVRDKLDEPDAAVQFVSCRTGEGIEDLKQAIFAADVLGVKRSKLRAEFQATSMEDLAYKKQHSMKAVNTYAWLGAANAVNPVPGLDVTLDVGMFYKLLSEIRRIFGITDDLAQTLEKYKVLAPIGQRVFSYATQEGVVMMVKKLAGEFAGKEISKYIPFVGQAAAAATGYMMIQKIGEKYVDDCYTIAQEILRGILKR